jgi:hypothetical protein
MNSKRAQKITSTIFELFIRQVQKSKLVSSLFPPTSSPSWRRVRHPHNQGDDWPILHARTNAVSALTSPHTKPLIGDGMVRVYNSHTNHYRELGFV